MRRRAILPDKDHFVLRAVKSAHTGIGLVPDADVLQFGVMGIASREHFAHMTPVHADLMDRTIRGKPAEQGIRTGEKCRELTLAHFAGSHRKFAMLDASQ